jgi:ribonuclease D
LVAPLLGFQENTGYAMLVSGFLNINLSKIHTRTDWSQRPLSAEQIQYAADDVIYLAKIYQMMQQKLQALQFITYNPVFGSIILFCNLLSPFGQDLYYC